MPVSRLVFAFFIMLGGSTMSLGRKFVLLGGFPMCVTVHDVSSFRSVLYALLSCARGGPIASAHRAVGPRYSSSANGGGWSGDSGWSESELRPGPRGLAVEVIRWLKACGGSGSRLARTEAGLRTRRVWFIALSRGGLRGPCGCK